MAGTIATLTTGPTASSSSIPATAVDPAVSTIKIQWDVSNNLSGSSVSSHIRCDVSQDNGTTWTTIVAAGRDKGYDYPGIVASATVPLPGVGNAQRMVRVFIILSASMPTTLTASLS